MEKDKVIITRREDIVPRHENHGEYDYLKHVVLPKSLDNQCTVAIMEIPPGKSAYPYHYHTAITEVFYIMSGSGVLETPEGRHEVTVGDVIAFPPGESGAHKIWNLSSSEPLVYLDVDTVSPADIAFYPHSKKAGLIIPGGENIFFRLSDAVDYYDGE